VNSLTIRAIKFILERPGVLKIDKVHMRLLYTIHCTHTLYSYTIRYTPYTVRIHHTPYTLHPVLIHHTPYTIHHTPYTIHPTPYTLHHTHCTQGGDIMRRARLANLRPHRHPRLEAGQHADRYALIHYTPYTVLILSVLMLIGSAPVYFVIAPTW
jgi:hypothetical protein